MKRSRFTEEQIVYTLRQADSGTPIGDLCRQLGIAEQTFYAWKTNSAGCGRWKRRTPGSNAWWRTSRSTSTCCRRPCEKQSEARPPPGTGPLVSGHLLGELCAGLSLSPVRPGVVVSTEHGQRSDGAAAADSGSGPCAAPVWVSADLGVAAP